MKKILMLIAACAAAVSLAAPYKVGYSKNAFANGCIIEGAIVVSTNPTQSATAKAVYEFPVMGIVEHEEIEVHKVPGMKEVENVRTNWCEETTEHYVVIGGVTNYYTDVSVWTNGMPYVREVPVTNKTYRTEIVEIKAVTNDLYSITATNGVGTDSTEKIIGAGAGILVTGAPVELIVK